MTSITPPDLLLPLNETASVPERVTPSLNGAHLSGRVGCRWVDRTLLSRCFLHYQEGRTLEAIQSRKETYLEGCCKSLSGTRQ